MDPFVEESAVLHTAPLWTCHRHQVRSRPARFPTGWPKKLCAIWRRHSVQACHPIQKWHSWKKRSKIPGLELLDCFQKALCVCVFVSILRICHKGGMSFVVFHVVKYHEIPWTESLDKDEKFKPRCSGDVPIFKPQDKALRMLKNVIISFDDPQVPKKVKRLVWSTAEKAFHCYCWRFLWDGGGSWSQKNESKWIL